MVSSMFTSCHADQTPWRKHTVRLMCWFWKTGNNRAAFPNLSACFLVWWHSRAPWPCQPEYQTHQEHRHWWAHLEDGFSLVFVVEEDRNLGLYKQGDNGSGTSVCAVYRGNWHKKDSFLTTSGFNGWIRWESGQGDWLLYSHCQIGVAC